MNNENSDFIDLDFSHIPEEKMIENASDFYELMNKRRTTRHFSKKIVPRDLIEMAIKTAGTAPSGAHLQPWTFVAISNEELKLKNSPSCRRGREENILRKNARGMG